MPGKKVGEYSWRYLTAPNILRVVSAAVPDADIAGATVEAVPESFDGSGGYAAYDNVLGLFAILDAGVTSAQLVVMVDIGALGAGVVIPGAERWCLVHTETVTRSAYIPVPNVPPGIVKIMVLAAAGAGNIKVGAMLPT
ncbi:MAG TPA: hypothetical protein ENH11_00930, partial [Candidatus Acetothermia bacterium]|nr:hypothetical protein [Candidatus Acetothermia bacterium]